ncbi:sensor histidine kinase [Mucilaginibacter phyllosphaerae]
MNKKSVRSHVLVWSAFIAYEILTVYFVMGRISDPADYFFHYLLNIGVFYTTAGILNGERKTFMILMYLTAMVVIYICINYYLNFILEYFKTKITRPTYPLRGFLIGSFWRCFYFAGLSAAYAFARNMVRSKEQLGQALHKSMEQERSQLLLEKELLVANNATLRAQINPHLFFNTLNFIYTSVYKFSATAGEAVMLLADITRYSISKADSAGLVYLQDEVTSVRDLIALNQIRFNSRLHIQLEIDKSFGDNKIVPLIMLTLVENVFKYGELTDDKNPALIKIQYEDGYFHFATRNKKSSHITENKGTGMGIMNTKMRLHRAYPNQFTFRINETETQFFIDLTIQAECLCLAVI